MCFLSERHSLQLSTHKHTRTCALNPHKAYTAHAAMLRFGSSWVAIAMTDGTLRFVDMTMNMQVIEYKAGERGGELLTALEDYKLFDSSGSDSGQDARQGAQHMLAAGYDCGRLVFLAVDVIQQQAMRNIARATAACQHSEHKLFAPGEAVTVLRFVPALRALAIGSSAGRIAIMDLDGKHYACRFYDKHHKTVHAIEYCLAFKYLVTAGQDRLIRIWGPRTGASFCRDRMCCGCVVASQHFALGPKSSIVDWTHNMPSLLAGRNIGTLRGHVSPIVSVIFHEDTELIISVDKASIVKFWDPMSETLVKSFAATTDPFLTSRMPITKILLARTQTGLHARKESLVLCCKHLRIWRLRGEPGVLPDASPPTQSQLLETGHLAAKLPLTGFDPTSVTTSSRRGSLATPEQPLTVPEVFDAALGAGEQVEAFEGVECFLFSVCGLTLEQFGLCCTVISCSFEAHLFWLHF